MTQLQQWANEGLYIFPCEEYPKGQFDGWELLYKLESEFSSLCGSLAGYMYRVLDGTIKVWRPVEHYPPPENTIFCLGRGVRIGNVEEKQDGFWLPTPESTYTNAVKITHWQPLPQPPQKGGE